MIYTDFINKIIVPFNILNINEADILQFQCQNSKIPAELFLLATKVLNKQAVLDLLLVKKGFLNLSRNEVVKYFDMNLLKNEIRKLIDKNIPNKMPAKEAVVSKADNIASLPKVGDILDKYEIREIIGQGATSTVYRAFHLFLKIDVAIKVLSPQLTINDPFIQEKFIDEAMHTAGISHKNLIKVFDVEQRGNLTYIVMEYINGNTVDTFIKNQKAMKPTHVIKIVMELCQVLESISKSGLIHRDIKPENIMINDKSEVKLADFGLAKNINLPDKYPTSEGIIYGTPFYMSPEQLISPDIVDKRSDLYSLGVTIYHMITGKLPFDTNSIEKIVYMHLHEKPVSPNSISSKISIELSDLILKLMEKNPKNRYQSYSELYIDLKAIDASYQKLARKTKEIKFNNQRITINMDMESIEKFVKLVEENPNRANENKINQAALPVYSQHSLLSEDILAA